MDTAGVHGIPVVDASPVTAGDAAGSRRVAGELLAIAETVGFFYIRGHGIGEDLITETFAMARRFFALAPEEKAEVGVAGRHRGWLRIGEAMMPDGRLPDLKESFIWGLDVAADDPEAQAPGRLIGPNRWPAALPQMRPLLNRYFEEANRCGIRLLGAIALGLGIAEDTFTRSFSRPVSRGSLIHYPPQPPAADDGQFGVSPHTDFGVLTLLAQDATGGLEIRGRAGEWVAATPIPGTLVVNVGDLLARWSNDRFASTPHRVVNRSGRERTSIAVFVDPDHDTAVEPVTRPGEAPRYEPVTCGAYILGRFDKSFAYRRG